MTYDPEQIRDERRELPRPDRPAAPTASAGASAPAPWPNESRTLEMLAKLREGSSLAAAERWLCVIRGDRKPGSPAELAAAIAELAADERQSIEAVRAGLERKLQAEGSSLAEWFARLSRPRKLLGRGSTTSTRGVAC